MIVFVIEDDRDLAGNIIDYLNLNSIECDYAERGDQALNLVLNNRYDVILLDIQLPKIDGFSLCRKIRAEGIQTPILMLTAKDTIADKLEGFNAGTDDYLVKPFHLDELLMRIHAMHKRGQHQSNSQVFNIADLTVDPINHSISRNNIDIELTPACWKILGELVKASPNIVKRVTLEHALWQGIAPDSEALKSHIYTLRKKIDRSFQQPLIHSIRGIGVALKLPPDETSHH